MEGLGVDPFEVRGRVAMQGQCRKYREPEDYQDNEADPDRPARLRALGVLLRRRHRLTPPCRAGDRPAARSTATQPAAPKPPHPPARSLPRAPRAAPTVAVDRVQPSAAHPC